MNRLFNTAFHVIEGLFALPVIVVETGKFTYKEALKPAAGALAKKANKIYQESRIIIGPIGCGKRCQYSLRYYYNAGGKAIRNTSLRVSAWKNQQISNALSVCHTVSAWTHQQRSKAGSCYQTIIGSIQQREAYKTIARPWQIWKRYDPAANAFHSSQDALRAIEQETTQILSKAQEANIAPNPPEITFLEKHAPDPPPVPLSPESVQQSHQKQIQKFTSFIGKRASMISTLYQMERWAGIPEGERPVPIATLIQDVKKADNQKDPLTAPPPSSSPRSSLWDLFLERHPNLSLFQKFKAGIFYWCLYKSSLVSNIMDTLWPTCVEVLMNRLKNPTLIQNFFAAKLLPRVQRLLEEEIRAYEQFTQPSETRGLKNILDSVNQYILEEMSQEFPLFLKEVLEKTPAIPILKTYQEVPILGRFCKKVQSWTNPILKKILKRYIPSLSQSGLNQFNERFEDDGSLPVKLNITRFLTTQLEALGKISLNSSEKIDPSSGMGSLPTIVDLLLKLLWVRKSRSMTRESLQKQLKTWESKQDRGDWLRLMFNQIPFIGNDLEKIVDFFLPDAKADQSLKEAFVQGGNKLFKFLNQNIQSKQFFELLLTQTSNLFTEPFRDTQALQLAVQTASAELQTARSETFNKIVKQAIDAQIYAAPIDDENEEAKKVFAERKAFAQEVFTQLQNLAENMQDQPTQIQVKIATFAHILQFFAMNRKTRGELSLKNPLHKDAIDRLLSPLYQQANDIQHNLQALQTLQTEHIRTKQVKDELASAQTLLSQCKRSPDVKKIETVIQKSTAWRQEGEPAPTIYSEILQQTQEFVKTKATVAALIAKKEGLKDQLKAWNETRRVWSRKSLRAKIESNLSNLTPAEQTKIRGFIDFEKIQGKWLNQQTESEFYAWLAATTEQYKEKLKKTTQTLTEKITPTVAILTGKFKAYETIQGKKERKLTQKTAKLHQDVQALRQKTSDLTLDLISAPTQGLQNAFGRTVYTAIGALPALVFPNLLSNTASFGATTANHLIDHFDPNHQAQGKPKNKGWVTQMTTDYLLMAGTAYAVSAAVCPVIGLALGAESTVASILPGATRWFVAASFPVVKLGSQKLAGTLIHKVVRPKVDEVFTDANTLIFDPRMQKRLAACFTTALIGTR